MATPPEQPWTLHEKNYLLAEIVKSANPPPDVLLGLIRNLNVKFRWDDIPLPLGRSLKSSKIAYDFLWRSIPTPPLPLPHTPTPLSAPIQPLKRTFQFEGSYSAGASNREIRPRPTAVGGGAYSQPSPSEPPPKRKRGRPTKAEAQAKAEAAAATSGEPGSATTSRSTTRIATSIPPPSMTATVLTEEPPKIPTTIAARMPIAAMLTPNPRESKSASHSGSSSGKRRRARSTKSEVEELVMTHGDGGGSQYESPYARIAPAGADHSPARAAVMRHREHTEPSRASSLYPPSTNSAAEAVPYPHAHQHSR